MPKSTALLMDAIGRQRLTVSNTALTLTIPSDTNGRPANFALMTVETNPVRWTIDGTTPVAVTTGHKLNAGDALELRGQDNLASFKVIRDGAADAALEVTYGRLKEN